MPVTVQFSAIQAPNAGFQAYVTGDGRYAILPVQNDTGWVVYDSEQGKMIVLPGDGGPFATVNAAKRWLTSYVRGGQTS